MLDKFGSVRIYNPNGRFLRNIIFGLVFASLIFASLFLGGIFNAKNNDITDVSASEITVTVSGNGGKWGTSSSLTLTCYNGVLDSVANRKKNATISVPTRASYEFIGIYDSNNVMVWDANGKAVLGTSYWNNNGYCTMANGSSFSAMWKGKPQKIYRVILPNGTQEYWKTVETGTTFEISFSEDSLSYTREGYSFASWSIASGDCSYVKTDYNAKLQYYVMGTTDVVIKANWRQADTTFPTTWKTEVASNNYMTSTILPTSLTSIKFETSIPSGYNLIGTLSKGINVYQKSTNSNDVAFVWGKSISAPADCSSLFSGLANLQEASFDNFDTTNITNVSGMFSGCSSLSTLDLSKFDLSNVSSSNISNMLNFGESCNIKVLKTPKKAPTSIPVTSNTNGTRLYNTTFGGYDKNVMCGFTYKRGCLITANANGGSIVSTTGWTGTGNSATKVVYYDSTSIGTLPTATRTGYNYSWSSTQTGGVEVTSLTTYTTDSTIYAIWKEKAVEVSYNFVNTQDAGSSVAGTYKTGNIINLRATANLGFTFAEWSKSAGTNTIPAGMNTTYTISAEDVEASANIVFTATAVANPISLASKTYRVTYKNFAQSLEAFDSATNGTGNYSYEISDGNSENYFTLNSLTRVITIKENTPIKNAYNLTITATDNTSHATTYATISIVIEKTDCELNVAPETLNIKSSGNSETTTVTYSYNGDGVVSAISNDSTIASVSVDATNKQIIVSATGFGTTTIIVSASEGANYKAPTSKTISVSVSGETYSITYITNGGTINSGKVENYSYGLGTILPTNVTKYGYNFNGWFAEQTLTNKVTNILNNESGNKIFYAGWVAKRVEIDYNFINTQNAGSSPSGDYTIGDVVTLSATENEECVFESWMKSNGNTLSNAKTSTYTITIDDVEAGVKITFTATAKACEYTLSYNLNLPTDFVGGVLSANTLKVGYGTNYSNLATISTLPTKHGYSITFDGWFTAQTGGIKVENGTKFDETSVGEVDRINKTGVLFAHWTSAIEEYTITFVTNNGTWHSGYVSPTKYTVEDGIILPTSDNIKLTNHRFDGWFESKTFEGEIVTEIQVGTTGNKTYYAKWTEKKDGKITIIINVDDELSSTRSYGVVKIEFTNNGERQLFTLALKEKTYTIDGAFYRDYLVSVINTKKINAISAQTVVISESNNNQTIIINVVKSADADRYI